MATNPAYPKKEWHQGFKHVGNPINKYDLEYCNCEECSKSEKPNLKKGLAFQKCTCSQIHKVKYRPHWVTDRCVNKYGNWNIIEEGSK